jgi:hypothetical protein
MRKCLKLLIGSAAVATGAVLVMLGWATWIRVVVWF